MYATMASLLKPEYSLKTKINADLPFLEPIKQQPRKIALNQILSIRPAAPPDDNRFHEITKVDSPSTQVTTNFAHMI